MFWSRKRLGVGGALAARAWTALIVVGASAGTSQGGNGCPADQNGSGAVEIGDLLALLAAWGPCAGCPADLDGDGAVAINDLLMLLTAWGPCTEPACLAWELPWQELLRVVDLPGGDLSEISGIEISSRNPGIVWAHDDSGHPADIYAVRLADGSLAQRYHIVGAVNSDWEDMAIGPGPVPRQDSLFIVDDDANYLLRLPEPVVPQSPQPIIDITEYELFYFQSVIPGSDGETLVVDPATGTPYFVAFNETVYRFPMPLDGRSVATLQPVATLAQPIGELSFRGGDASPSGDRVVLRGYNNVYEFIRPAGAPFESAFLQAPCITDASGQGQAESIAFGLDGISLYAISEGNGPWIRLLQAAE